MVNRPNRARPPLDVPGTVSASAGLFALVYGCSNAEMSSWSDPLTIILLTGAARGLGGDRVAQLLPAAAAPGGGAHRTRGGAYLSVGVVSVAIFGVFVFLTYYLQRVRASRRSRRASPSYLSAVVMTTADRQHQAAARPAPLLTLGLALGGVALLWLAQLALDCHVSQLGRPDDMHRAMLGFLA